MLDAIFNACMVDGAPFRPSSNPAGRAFAPLPPEVDLADKAATGTPPAPPSGPVGSAAPQRIEGGRWGEA